MNFFEDIIVPLFFLGLGVYYLLGTLWPARFARGYLQHQLQRERQPADRQILRIASGITGVGSLLMGITAIATSAMPNFPLYTFAGVALGLMVISILVTHF